MLSRSMNARAESPLPWGIREGDLIVE